MVDTFAIQSFAFQAFTVAVLTGIAVLGILFLVNLPAWLHVARTVFEDEDANVDPVDPDEVRERLARWSNAGDTRAPCRVVPLPQRQTVKLDGGRTIEAELR